MKILIVDDNIDLADSLADMLDSEGHDVDVAYKGLDGLEKFTRVDYDLTLLDAKLPDISGVKIFNKLNNIKPDRKIIMMTGFRVEQLLAYGSGDNIVVIRKPVFGELVLQSLAKMIKGVMLIADNKTGLRDELLDCLQQTRRNIGVITDEASIGDIDLTCIDVLLFDTQRTILYDLNTYEQLKETGYQGVAVILARQSNEEDTSDALKSIDVTGCLFKPFNPEELFNVIGL